jgi:hypothetical protein
MFQESTYSEPRLTDTFSCLIVSRPNTLRVLLTVKAMTGVNLVYTCMQYSIAQRSISYSTQQCHAATPVVVPYAAVITMQA